MALERCVTEMGMGVDVHGRDYTSAARRAVSDAIRHSSLSLFSVIGKTRDEMRIVVVIGVPEPDQVDLDAVGRELPYGQVTVTAQRGGLEVQNADSTDAIVIANAAVLVHFEMP
ncbi:MAG: Lin0512 family protein [Alphaproteobacteria bacterium]|nr:Lin0512 family protein [Alphaproteobacteria bacterium]